MRIFFIIPGLTIGGAERSFIRAIQAIQPYANRVSALILTDADPALLPDIPSRVSVYVLKLGTTANPLLWLRVRRILKKEGPDVVVGWSMYANFVTVAASIWARWKVVLSERVYIPQFFAQKRMGLIRKFILVWLIRKLYRKANTVTANSPRSVRFLSKFIGGSPVYAHLPNALDVDIANNLATIQPEIPPFRVEGPRILAIGRLDYQKGFDLLLEALALIRRHHSWQLLLVGDGPEREHLKNLARSLGISQAVQWIGAVKNPFPYYRWADLVVLPSRFEGFPNVALEAMGCGRTVICAECKSGPAELTEGGKYGVLIPPNNVRELADALIRWGTNQDARDAMGASAFEHIRNVYDIGQLRSHYVQTLCALRA